MWSSFSRRRLWIKPGVFIRDITATVSWQCKELVTPIVRMFRKYFWDSVVMKNDRNKRNPRNDFAWFARRFQVLVLVLVLVVLVLSLVSFRWFRFVVSGFSSGQTRSEQMNKTHQIRLFRRYSGFILPRYFQVIMLHVYCPFSVLSNYFSWNDLADSSVFKHFQLSVCGL